MKEFAEWLMLTHKELYFRLVDEYDAAMEEKELMKEIIGANKAIMEEEE